MTLGCFRKTVIVLKGYPRLSETFIAQEIRALEQRGFEFVIYSMRWPTDPYVHPVHDEIAAPIYYLPEYLHDEPIRVLRCVLKSIWRPRFWAAFPQFLIDFVRDRSRNRVRRFGQAIVLAAEIPDDIGWLHCHFIHTPASVTAYASRISGLSWTCSAHAKDIWTSPEWELKDKLRAARWTVTCTKFGYDYLRKLVPERKSVHLCYHGLDLDRFGHYKRVFSLRDGSSIEDPVLVISVGRAVAKKGYDILLRALSLLPSDLSWQFCHIGGGDELDALQRMADELGIGDRTTWLGPQQQTVVLENYRKSDLFVLACRVASDGDRDGLPNVLVEASSQGLACISTDVSGVPELLINNETGLVVPPEDPKELALALEQAIRNPSLRKKLGTAAEKRVRKAFDLQSGIDQLASLFRNEWGRL
jgi:glycosyltransferase involved in cell wall biosynthesis